MEPRREDAPGQGQDEKRKRQKKRSEAVEERHRDLKQKETPMWQAVDVEDDTSTPPWAQPWTASKEKEEAFNAINEDPRNADSCVIEMENPSTSYLHERPSRAANRYGSPFRSPNMGGKSRRPAYSIQKARDMHPQH